MSVCKRVMVDEISVPDRQCEPQMNSRVSWLGLHRDRYMEVR